MRVPVYLLPKAPAGTAAFIDPTAVTVWESGGPPASNTDPVNIVDNYSVYGYMAVARNVHRPACCLSSCCRVK